MTLTIKAHERATKTYWRIADHYGGDLPAPYPVFYSDPDDGFGYWDTDCIWINFAWSTWEEIVGTMIHEYQHHIQPADMDEDEAEAEADEVAARDLHLFLGDDS